MFEGKIKDLDPKWVFACGKICDEVLEKMKEADIAVDAMFYIHLLNAAALAVADLNMPEERFIDLCRQQFRLYLEFQFAQTGQAGTG